MCRVRMGQRHTPKEVPKLCRTATVGEPMIYNISRVLRVGSSLAITIQPNILDKLALKRGDRVGIWVEGDYAVMRRIPMEELIKIRPQITQSNAHAEVRISERK